MSFAGDLYSQADEVISTKGDLRRGDASGNPERYGIGSSNQVLSVSSGNILWKTLPTADSIITTEGDIIVGDSSGDGSRLGFGTSGYFLKTQGASNPPVWSAVSAGASTALDNLSSVAVNDTINMNTNNLTNTQYFGCKAYLEKTISSGNITFTQTLTEIDTEADASTDDLDGFLGLVDGYWLSLKSVDNARDPTLRSGVTGENKMNGVGSYTLADKDYRWIGNCYIGGYFNIQELSRSSNTA